MTTAAEAMLTDVKLSGADATVGELRRLFADDHVHAAVLVDGTTLLAVVERDDLVGLPAARRAVTIGLRAARTVGPDADLDTVRDVLVASGGRRLAVTTPDGRFLGLLCLKRTRQGFCSDRDVRSRGCAPRLVA